MSEPETDSSLDITTLLASSIHDIKNSLNLLLAEVDLVSDFLDMDDTVQSRTLMNLKATTKRLNNELTQLLVLYRLKTGTYQVNPVFINIGDFIEERYEEQKTFLEMNNIELKVDCSAEMYWNIDPMLVTIAINNAINNARRYARGQVILSAHEQDKMLCIQIQDNGEGFPDKLLKNTGINTIEPGSGNTGVGLYFCNEIAKGHRRQERSGRLQLDNTGPDGGASISLLLP